MNLPSVYTQIHNVPVALNFDEARLVNRLESNLGYLEATFITGEAESEDIIPLPDRQELYEFLLVMGTTVSVLGDQSSVQEAQSAFKNLGNTGFGSYLLRLKNHPDVVYQITLSRKDKELFVSTKRYVN